jgi:hypothetical protein
MNSFMPYYPPFTQGYDAAMLWLNLDPGYRTAATGGVDNWLNFMKPSDVFSNTNSTRRPADNGTHITFDGGDFLRCNVDRLLDTSATGWTVYIRYKEDDWSDNSTISSDDDSNNYFIKNVGNLLSVKLYNGSSTETENLTFDDPTDLIDDTFTNIAVTCTTGGLLTAYINGTAQADTETVSATTFDMMYSEVGGKNGAVWLLTGSIQEVLVWHKPLSALEVGDVNTYLNNKF